MKTNKQWLLEHFDSGRSIYVNKKGNYSEFGFPGFEPVQQDYRDTDGLTDRLAILEAATKDVGIQLRWRLAYE
jgi:hypothetical protein